MKLNLTRNEKLFLSVFGIVYAALIVYVIISGYEFDLEGVGIRWIYQLPFGEGPLSRINPMTVFMTWGIMALIIIVAMSFRRFELLPGKRQTLMETLLGYMLELTEDAVPRKRFIKPTFVIACTLFIFILIANIITAFPGLNTTVTEDGMKLTLFQDTWYSPTSDLNTNATYAVMVLVISHVFAIKAKGFSTWIRSFFQPHWLMLPMNVISEIAKPISHSLRLFGNIMGGGLLVLIISYLIKYFVMPPFLWGFFGLFSGAIQALVFSMLAIAYIGSLLE